MALARRDRRRHRTHKPRDLTTGRASHRLYMWPLRLTSVPAICRRTKRGRTIVSHLAGFPHFRSHLGSRHGLPLHRDHARRIPAGPKYRKTSIGGAAVTATTVGTLPHS